MSNAPERILVYPYADGYDGDCHVSTQHHECEERTQYIRADLAPQWQPIKTAPKDGTEFQMRGMFCGEPYWIPCGKFETPQSQVPSAYMFESHKFLKTKKGDVTHWMPSVSLDVTPTPPTALTPEP